MEQKNENTIIINTTNLENCRAGLKDKLYGIDNTIKTELLCELDKVLNSLKDYNGKEIKKEKEGFDIDVMLYDLNEYIDGLNKDKKLTNSLKFGVIKSVIEDFRKEYYNTIGIDISEEKEEDVSVNRVRYFDKYLNSEKERRSNMYKCVMFTLFSDKSFKEECTIETQIELINEFYNKQLNKMNIGKKTQEQQGVYFEEDEESLKSKSSSSNLFSSSSSDDWPLLLSSSSSNSFSSSSNNDQSSLLSSSSSNSFLSSSNDDRPLLLSSSLSEDYDSAIEEIEGVVVNQTNSRSSSPVNGF